MADSGQSSSQTPDINIAMLAKTVATLQKQFQQICDANLGNDSGDFSDKGVATMIWLTGGQILDHKLITIQVPLTSHTRDLLPLAMLKVGRSCLGTQHYTVQHEGARRESPLLLSLFPSVCFTFT